jgi:sugar/nucleoside kinase (ribokinase family)
MVGSTSGIMSTSTPYATNAAVILAGLGNRVRLSGNRLGRDRRGHWLRARLARITNLDVSLLHLDPQAATPRNIILSARNGTRTILGDAAPLVGVPLSDRDFDDVRMVVLDPYECTASPTVGYPTAGTTKIPPR